MCIGLPQLSVFSMPALPAFFISSKFYQVAQDNSSEDQKLGIADVPLNKARPLPLLVGRRSMCGSPFAHLLYTGRWVNHCAPVCAMRVKEKKKKSLFGMTNYKIKETLIAFVISPAVPAIVIYVADKTNMHWMTSQQQVHLKVCTKEATFFTYLYILTVITSIECLVSNLYLSSPNRNRESYQFQRCGWRLINVS